MSPLFLIAMLLWMAVTDFSNVSLLISGVAVSLALEKVFCFNPPWSRFYIFICRLLPALIVAYRQAFALMFSLDYRNYFFTKEISDRSSWNIFMSIFLVTLTPKTVSVNVDNPGEMLVHQFEGSREDLK